MVAPLIDVLLFPADQLMPFIYQIEISKSKGFII